MKDSELSRLKSEKEIETLKGELAGLLEYKIQQQEEIRKAKKLEKKLKQKEKKKASQSDENVLESGLETVEVVPTEIENAAIDEASFESGTLAVKEEDTIANVEVKNRFKSLDINSNVKSLAHYHPDESSRESSPESVSSSDQKISIPGTPGSSCPLGGQPFTSPSSAVATLAVSPSLTISFQDRIQCDQCARKCVDKRDMECHIFLWHSDWRNVNSKKEGQV